MEKYEDLFILGAGASHPYGFPVGSTLADQIHKCLEIPLAHVDRYSEWYTDKSFLECGAKNSQPHLDQAVKIFMNIVRAESIRRHGKEFKTTQNEADEILEDIKEFYEAISSVGEMSIDEFLKIKRQDIQVIGKCYISAILILCEDPRLLMQKRGPIEWYSYLCRRLFGHLDNLKDFDNRGINILTFNYDRSLEQFLFSRLRHSFPNNDEEVIQAISKLKITHIHGTIGNLFGPESRVYSTQINPDVILKSASKISIIHDNEEIEKSDNLLRARELTKHHSKFHFLGFGFDLKNMQRLNLEEVPVHGGTGGILIKNKKIHGIVYGESKKKMDALKENLNKLWQQQRVKIDFKLSGQQEIKYYLENERTHTL